MEVHRVSDFSQLLGILNFLLVVNLRVYRSLTTDPSERPTSTYRLCTSLYCRVHTHTIRGIYLPMFFGGIAGVAFTVPRWILVSLVTASKEAYRIGFLFSLCVDGLVYYVCVSSGTCRFCMWVLGRGWCFEEMAANKGFFDHESVSIIAGLLDGKDIDIHRYIAKVRKTMYKPGLTPTMEHDP